MSLFKRTIAVKAEISKIQQKLDELSPIDYSESLQSEYIEFVCSKAYLDEYKRMLKANNSFIKLYLAKRIIRKNIAIMTSTQEGYEVQYLNHATRNNPYSEGYDFFVSLDWELIHQRLFGQVEALSFLLNVIEN